MPDQALKWVQIDLASVSGLIFFVSQTARSEHAAGAAGIRRLIPHLLDFI
jgi:hypothetical protein